MVRTAKFCEQNIKSTDSWKAVELLHSHYPSVVDVKIVDCFRRCLQCRVKPFCRIQLTTFEANDADTLVSKIIEAVHEE